MKIKPIISKNANFYFLIQNLSEWHFSCKKEFNDFWQRKTELLSEEEKKLLNDFKEIRLKYPTSKSVFERAFYLENDPFLYLEKELNEKEYKRVCEVFIAFEKRFQSFYLNELPFFKNWEKELSELFHNDEKICGIVSDLSILYGVEKPNKEISTYLLFSTPNNIGGGANIDEKSISIELSQYPLENINKILGIIWHEIIHLCFDKVNLHPMMREMFKEEEMWHLIKELTASSLFPKGILASKYFGVEISNKLHKKISSKYSDKVIGLVGDYLMNKKTLDEKYLKEVALIIDSQNEDPA